MLASVGPGRAEAAEIIARTPRARGVSTDADTAAGRTRQYYTTMKYYIINVVVAVVAAAAARSADRR